MAFNVRQMPADRAAAIEDGIEEERETERAHERAAAADDEDREAARVAELRRQGLICEDSAAHNAATAVPNGVALGVPGDIAEAARWARRGREAQGRHVSRGAFRVYAMKDTSDRGPVSGPLSP